MFSFQGVSNSIRSDVKTRKCTFSSVGTRPAGLCPKQPPKAALSGGRSNVANKSVEAKDKQERKNEDMHL